MFFADAIQTRKHNWHYNSIIFLNKRHGIFIIPEVQRSLCNLRWKREFQRFSSSVMDAKALHYGAHTLPENVDWRHIWRFDEIVALEFSQIAVDRWHPKFLLFHLKTSLLSVNMSSARISRGHARPAQSERHPFPEIVPHSTLAEHDIMINISLCEVATELWPETAYAPLSEVMRNR